MFKETRVNITLPAVFGTTSAFNCKIIQITFKFMNVYTSQCAAAVICKYLSNVTATCCGRHTAGVASAN